MAAMLRHPSFWEASPPRSVVCRHRFFCQQTGTAVSEERSWRILDCAIGLIMLFTSSLLVWNYGFTH
jgi:hypothetical protein